MHGFGKWMLGLIFCGVLALPASAEVRYAKHFDKGERVRLDASMVAAEEMLREKVSDLTDRTDVSVTIMKSGDLDQTIKEYRELRGMKPVGNHDEANKKGLKDDEKFERLAVTMVNPATPQLIRIVLLEAVCDETMLDWLQHVLGHELLHAWVCYQDYLQLVKPKPGYKSLSLDEEEFIVNSLIHHANVRFMEKGGYRVWLSDHFPDRDYAAFELSLRAFLKLQFETIELYRKRIQPKNRQSAVPRGAAAFFLL